MTRNIIELRQAALAGDLAAMKLLADRSRESDPAEAVRWLRRAVALGDPPAMVDLGMLLQGGEDDLKPEVEHLWQRAAEAGDATAMVNLGATFAMSSNLGKAEHWFRLAAASGSEDGMFMVANLAIDRNDLGTAAYFWTLAASAGHPEARSKADALDKWQAQLREQAAAGNAQSMFRLAEVLEHLDPAASMAWLKQAADAGFQPARGVLAAADQAKPGAP